MFSSPLLLRRIRIRIIAPAPSCSCRCCLCAVVIHAGYRSSCFPQSCSCRRAVKGRELATSRIPCILTSRIRSDAGFQLPKRAPSSLLSESYRASAASLGRQPSIGLPALFYNLFTPSCFHVSCSFEETLAMLAGDAYPPLLSVGSRSGRSMASLQNASIAIAVHYSAQKCH